MHMPRSAKVVAVAAVVAVGLAAPVAGLAGERTIAQGQFSGASGHTASGGVAVRETESGTVVVLQKDFKFDGAPDPKLGFGKDGYDAASQFSELRSNGGEQLYELPANIDPNAYNEIWVWCQQYAVPLGVARLTKE